MGVVAERLLLRYRDFERKKDALRISIANRQAIVAAGIYENPVDYLNEATESYHNLVHFIEITEQSVDKSKSNEELFEEWKRIFGKMEENSPEAQ